MKRTTDCCIRTWYQRILCTWYYGEGIVLVVLIVVVIKTHDGPKTVYQGINISSIDSPIYMFRLRTPSWVLIDVFPVLYSCYKYTACCTRHTCWATIILSIYLHPFRTGGWETLLSFFRKVGEGRRQMTTRSC